MSAILRFAPSPNGLLHLGHAYSALLNDRIARRLAGAWLLRIEDIDPLRSRPAFEAAICEDLAWLGLRWPEPARRQSDHLGEYGAAGQRLRGRGLLYPCFCTRGEIVRAATARAAGAAPARDPDGTPLYPGTCRALGAAEREARLRADHKPAWRLDVGKALGTLDEPVAWRRFDPCGAEDRVAADPARWGDAVILRRDVAASYHLCVVHDDALQDVSHVVRGADLEAATDLHALLARLLDLPLPCFHHHALIRDRDGAKLAKSMASEPLRAFRAAGHEPDDIRRELGFEACA